MGTTKSTCDAPEIATKEVVKAPKKRASSTGTRKKKIEGTPVPVSSVREDIRVIGVGGGGGNALNHIISSGTSGASFIAANTDAGALGLSLAETKIPIGSNVTRGLGAGARPEVGESAAKESLDVLRASVQGADMVFVTAGMGGGTGTGAAPIVASLAKESGALVVGVVTMPFFFEMGARAKNAYIGLENMKRCVDSLIVVENDKILDIAGEKVSQKDAFAMADNVLQQAVKGVIDLIISPGLVNVDFADVRTVLQNSGSAVMGIGTGEGLDRATKAAREAIKSPLMRGSIQGASGILFNVESGEDFTMHEIAAIAKTITEIADDDAMVIWGHTTTGVKDGPVKVTLIAAGFPEEKQHAEVSNRSSNVIPFNFSKNKSALLEDNDPSTIETKESFVARKTVHGYDVPSIIRNRRMVSGG